MNFPPTSLHIVTTSDSPMLDLRLLLASNHRYVSLFALLSTGKYECFSFSAQTNPAFEAQQSMLR